MSISEEINQIIEPKNVFSFRLAGLDIGVRDSVVALWVITIIIVIAVKFIMKEFKTIPGKKQNLAESFVEMISNFIKSNGGEHHYKEIVPFIGTVILFVSFANMGAIFNVIPDPEDLYKIFKWDFLLKLPAIRVFPPTKDINITLGFAVFALGMVFYKTMKVKKIKGGLHTFVEPVPLMLPFKMLDYVVRPLSLTLRMFGNIMAAYIMMELIYLAFPLVLPGVLSLYFDIFDGVLQAYIFTFLTTLYMAEALE
jgi:F-type H+-transporting ATPase subunit a